MLFSIASAIARAGRRRRRMLEERRRRELERLRREGGAGGSPFAGLPFGGLLEAVMGPAGAWTRTLEYDDRTERWIDVSGRGAGSGPSAEPEPSSSGREQPRFQRSSSRRAQPANPLTTLL